MKVVNRVNRTLSNNDGLIRTRDMEKKKVPRMNLTQMARKGELVRVSRGIYAKADDLVDEMRALQMRFPRAVFSHDSALFLYDFTDRAPLSFVVTVPSGYNAGGLRAVGVRVFYIKSQLYEKGLSKCRTMFGNEVTVYDKERTICDIIRSRKQLDAQVFNEALKAYVADSNKNLLRLMEYAAEMRVAKVVRHYLEVLL